MITTNVLQRTFQLKHKSELGTCFTIDVDSRQYIVTAKHCVEDLDPAQLQIFHEGDYRTLNVFLVGYGTHDADIAVLATNIQLSPTYPLPASVANLALGQDAFFLGFPFGLRYEAGARNRGFPFPLVKQAIVSALPDFASNLQTIILDGHNNPGFSGGPVIFAPMGGPDTNYSVGAVISGYRFQHEDVLLNDAPTGLVYKANTGIVICHSIRHAKDVIGSNPIGFELPSDADV